jgi:hypothetical protein
MRVALGLMLVLALLLPHPLVKSQADSRYDTVVLDVMTFLPDSGQPVVCEKVENGTFRVPPICAGARPPILKIPLDEQGNPTSFSWSDHYVIELPDPRREILPPRRGGDAHHYYDGKVDHYECGSWYKPGAIACDIDFGGVRGYTQLWAYFCSPQCRPEYRTSGSIHNYPSEYGPSTTPWYVDYLNGKWSGPHPCEEHIFGGRRTSGTGGSLTPTPCSAHKAEGLWGIGIDSR